MSMLSLPTIPGQLGCQEEQEGRGKDKMQDKYQLLNANYFKMGREKKEGQAEKSLGAQGRGFGAGIWQGHFPQPGAYPRSEVCGFGSSQITRALILFSFLSENSPILSFYLILSPPNNLGQQPVSELSTWTLNPHLRQSLPGAAQPPAPCLPDCCPYRCLPLLTWAPGGSRAASPWDDGEFSPVDQHPCPAQQRSSGSAPLDDLYSFPKQAHGFDASRFPEASLGSLNLGALL